MKFFIDSADVKEIQEASKKGLVDGVTTNPSLIAKTGRNREEVLAEICSLIKGPISAEVNSLNAQEMYAEGVKLAKIHDNIVIKVPMTEEGLVVVRKFASEGIKTNVTLVFSALQALLVAKAGATMVSPFIGRLDDTSADGMTLIRDIVQIYQNYDFKTEILAASIRHPVHILHSALAGADICTVPLKTLNQMSHHPLTDKGIEIFLQDWKNSQNV